MMCKLMRSAEMQDYPEIQECMKIQERLLQRGSSAQGNCEFGTREASLVNSLQNGSLGVWVQKLKLEWDKSSHGPPSP